MAGTALKPRLKLEVCAFFVDEFQAALAAEGRGDVELVPIQGACDERHRPAIAETQPAPIGAPILRLMCICSGHAACPKTPHSCFEFLLGPDKVDALLGEGAHLLTPAMARAYPETLQSPNESPESLHASFAESVRAWVVVDTGVASLTAAEQMAFLSATGGKMELLPTESYLLRANLRAALAQWEAAAIEARSAGQLASLQQRLADYTMAYDLISRLIPYQGEQNIVQSILDLFFMLCAPRAVHLLLVQGGGKGSDANIVDGSAQLFSQPADSGNEDHLRALLRCPASWGEIEAPPGFYFQIHGGETLGAVVVEGVFLPEQQRNYLDLALLLMPVLRVALHNARSYERLCSTERELRASHMELEQRVEVRTRELRESEEQLKEAQRIACVGNWRLDVATNHVIWSEELYRMLGQNPVLPPPDYTEHHRLFTPESWERLSATLPLTRETGIPYELELEIVRPDGGHGWIQARGEAQRDASGSIVALQGTAVDITERKHAEEELRIAAAAFNTQDAIMISDADGNVIRVNQAFLGITGYSPEEAQGKHVSIIKQGQDGQDSTVIKILQQSALNGSWAGEIYGTRKNGQIYPVWMTATPITNEQKETTHHVFIFSDITTRKQLEEAVLRESEERFRGTLEQAAVGIAHTTMEGYIQQVNQKFCDIIGYTRDELLQMRFQDFSFPDDLDGNVRCRQQLLAGEISTFSIEKRYVRKDRSLIWAKLTCSLLRGADGTPILYIGVIEDITEHKRLKENLLRSETKFRTIYEFSGDAIMLLDEKGFFDCNETTLRMFGCAAADGFINKHPSNFSPPAQPCGQDSMNLAQEHIATAFKNGSNHFEWLHRRLDGTDFMADVLLTSMSLDGRQVLQATVRDITEHKRAEQQLHDLTTYIEKVREEEKTSVAREIHDDLGGVLTALKIDAYWLARNLPSGNEAAPLRERVASMSGMIVDAVTAVRRIISDLRPAILDDLGLLATLEWNAAQFHKRTGIECRVVCPGSNYGDDELSKSHSINLFRIFQEALTNVARHSGATFVEVEFLRDREKTCLSIRDNGCGLPERLAIAATSFGIRGMRERAEQLGGLIRLGSSYIGGLDVTVIVPLSAGDKQGGAA
ncbi:MAG: PAS domain S-box protein [Nitrosomonadales bacterium]|nr:PAS domain S-box protein [Nitrosomonadales bacterium]